MFTCFVWTCIKQVLKISKKKNYVYILEEPEVSKYFSAESYLILVV